jgi:DNA-directed RNA polymerase specialized sigma24 family protein
MPAFAFATIRTSDSPKIALSEVGVISDAQLLALAAESRHDALDALYTAYKSRIYTFLLRFLADPELADDVTQEAFTKAFSALPKLERGTKVLPWLYKVASNTAIDHLRRKKRFTWIRMGDMQNTRHEPHMADAAAGSSPRSG